MKKQNNVPSVQTVLSLLGEQMNHLRPKNKPSVESVQAAKGTATLVNSYLGTVRLSMEFARLSDKKPNLDFLQIPTSPVGSKETVKRTL